MADLTLEMIREVIREELAAIRPLVDGIPVIGRAVTVLQRDLQSLRDDMRVLTAIVIRLDNTRDRNEGLLIDILHELRATHVQIARMNDRVRNLEDSKT